MSSNINIDIAKDFSDTPGPRYSKEGDFPGELFRKEVLLPKLKEAIELDVKLIVNLDGTEGYASSFLEESFAGLVSKEKIDYSTIKEHLICNSKEDTARVDYIWQKLDEANQDIPHE